jgi:hypothetical protein
VSDVRYICNLKEMLDIEQVWDHISACPAISSKLLIYIVKINIMRGGKNERKEGVIGQNVCRWPESGQLRRLDTLKI